MESNVHSYIQFAAALGRETERVGPFLATFTRGSTNPYYNYAVPDVGASPSTDDIAALVAASERRKRKPRLEYVASAAPDVEAALVEGGFHIEGRLPLMLCSAETDRDVVRPPGIEVLVPSSDAEFAGVVSVTRESYGGAASPPTDAEIAARRGLVERGGLVVLARDAGTLEPAGSGICEVPWERMSELATVGVRPGFRGRGVAAAVTARLAAEAFARGIGVLWLTPRRDAGERLYSRVGFVADGEVLHLSRETAVGEAQNRRRIGGRCSKVEDGRRCLDALPDVVEGLARRWRLGLGRPCPAGATLTSRRAAWPTAPRRCARSRSLTKRTTTKPTPCTSRTAMLVVDKANWWSSWMVERLSELATDTERRLAVEAAEIAAAYCRDDGVPYLVNRDAHLDNVLAADREPWALIDP